MKQYQGGLWFGSVGRAVAGNIRGPQFESSNQEKYMMNISTVNYWKDKNEEKGVKNVLKRVDQSRPLSKEWFGVVKFWKISTFFQLL